MRTEKSSTRTLQQTDMTVKLSVSLSNLRGIDPVTIAFDENESVERNISTLVGARGGLHTKTGQSLAKRIPNSFNECIRLKDSFDTDQTNPFKRKGFI